MFLEFCLYLRVAASDPVPDILCPAESNGVERAVRYQADADKELEAGLPAQAAELLGGVADAYPECRAYHARRMITIQRALDAHHSAFVADRQPRHLPAALARIDRYLESLRVTDGDLVVKTTGLVCLSEARAALILDMPAESAPLPPIEAQKVDRRGNTANRASVAGVVGASVLTATGVALLGVGARRRASAMSLAPTLHPRFVGLNLQGRF